MYRSIHHFLEATAEKYKHFPAFSLKRGFRTKTYTYQEAYEFSLRFPSFFAQQGIHRRDKIIVLSQNRPEYAILHFGAWLAGVIVVPVDYRTNEETIARFVNVAKPKAIFTTPVFKELFRHTNHRIIFLDELLPGILRHGPSFNHHQEEKELATILFTSGTTGEPKGTEISYANILSAVNGIREVFVLPEHLRILSLLPLSHALEIFGGLTTAYSFGCHIHYLERINSITIIQALRRYHIQAMAVVPQMLRLLLGNIERRVKEENREKEWQIVQALADFLPTSLRRLLFYDIHSALGHDFRYFISGSAPLEVKLAKVWERMGIQVIEGYGASETTGFVATNTLTDNKLGTVGKILPILRHKQTETGELLVAGENIASGYYENAAKTKEAFIAGWFHTGDIVSFDSDGRMSIVGRDKFKIVLPDGKKVYPEDIEKKLNNHPQVVDSTVFGIPTEDGERIHAEVITRGRQNLTKIIAAVNQTLNPHEQIIDYGHWEGLDFPRTKTLKVDREAVRQRVLTVKGNVATTDSSVEEEAKDALLRILSDVSGKKHINMHGNTTLATDLALDSLKRIELLARIEEEMGVSVDELAIKPQTTISQLREFIEHGSSVKIDDGEHIFSWQMNDITDAVRVFLQDFLAFPIFNIPLKIQVIHPENLAKIRRPQLFIFNHVGAYDGWDVIRALPGEIRRKTAIAAAANLWHDVKWHGYMISLFGNGFPLVRAESHKSMRGNFERVGEVLDRGYNILLSPEGRISHTGRLLSFHTGAGYIALEMGVPITPFKLIGHYEIWPDEPKRKLNLLWPRKFGTVQVVVGEPITFAKGTSYEKATEILHEKMMELE